MLTRVDKVLLSIILFQYIVDRDITASHNRSLLFNFLLVALAVLLTDKVGVCLTTTCAVIFLQQTIDELGDLLEDRRHGRHVAILYSVLPNIIIISTENMLYLPWYCFFFSFFLSAEVLRKLQIFRSTFLC